MIYLVGDLQGCCDAFDRLLAAIDFSPSRDELYLLGDLVNRGPESLRTLRRVTGFDGAARCVLGNHDLHLLAAAAGARKPSRGDTLAPILEAPDREALLAWLRRQPLALQAHGWLLVHAGVLPQWDAAQALSLAAEVQDMLTSDALPAFLHRMYGNKPAKWSDDLAGDDRLRLIINAFTRLRLCTADGTMDFDVKEGADAAPPHLMPWFDVPGRRTAGTPIAFGHWSTLGVVNRPTVLALDTGCVWGGALTAARVDGLRRELLAVPCEQARKPGVQV